MLSVGSSSGQTSSVVGNNSSNSVWYLIKDAIRELSKLADEGISILRAEVQVACFYQLHQFAHLKLGKT